jgi:hypothetical protein
VNLSPTQQLKQKIETEEKHTKYNLTPNKSGFTQFQGLGMVVWF